MRELSYKKMPVEPLIRVAEMMGGEHSKLSQQDLADMIGISSRAITRWRKEGGIPWISADEAAVAIGLHPLLVWGDDWLNVRDDFDKLERKASREMQRHEAEVSS